MVEQLQGAVLPASILERDVLPARLPGYRPEDLDTLQAAGEVVWVGQGALGERDGRLALFLADAVPFLLPPRAGAAAAASCTTASASTSRADGASFFARDPRGGGERPGASRVWTRSGTWSGRAR